MAKLIQTVDGAPSRAHELGDEEVVIGRRAGCSIRIDDPALSAQHARIVVDGDGYVLLDLASTNGTYVDDQRVTRVRLCHGSIIAIGNQRFSFLDEANADNPAPNTRAGTETDPPVANETIAPRTDMSPAGATSKTRQKQKKRQAVSYGSASEQTLYFSSAKVRAATDAATADDSAPAHAESGRKAPQAETARPDTAKGDVQTAASALDRLARFVPALGWMPRYRKSDLRGDIVAGLTVTVMLIPQGMAYAMLAGLPPVMGLYASIFPMLIYALLGTSRQLSVGPVALDSLLVAAGIGAIAELGGETFIALAILTAALVGLLQLIMGLARVGFIVNFLSSPVICGFTAAAALIIAFSQFKNLLGIELPQSFYPHIVLWNTIQRLSEINLPTLFIGGGSIIGMVVLKRIRPSLPGALIVVVAGTLLVALFGLQTRGVQIVGDIPAGLPGFALPAFDMGRVRELFPVALTIALVGFMEAISVGKVFADRGRYTIDANQELVAIGLANLGGSLFKGFPVTGGFSRSAVNAHAGARTGLATVITAVLIAVTLLFFTSLFYYLPKAVLAAIIMVAVVGLIDIKEVARIARVRKTDGLVFLLTFVATLGLGIQQGLLIGVAASILLFISLNTRPNTAILGRLGNTNIFRDRDRFPEAKTIEGVVVLRIDASFYFANVAFLKEKLREIEETRRGELKAVVLEASSINDLDSSADAALHQIADDYANRGIELYIANVKGPVRDVMKRSGLYDQLGADHFFFSVDAAVKRIGMKYKSE